MSRRGACTLLLALAIAGCASAPSTVIERYPLNKMDPPLPGAVRVARVKGPKRPRTVAAIDFDIRALPTLEEVALGDLASDAGRLRLSHGVALAITGLEGVDVEVGDDRWFAEKGSIPTGTARFGGSPSNAFVAWRGPATVDDAGRLRFFCFEGQLQNDKAEASSAYLVDAEPVVPGVVWAFRSGRPGTSAPPPVRDRKGSVIVAPEPCIGFDRVEFIGPSAFSIIGSSIDPRDIVAKKCNTDGGCPFSRVAVPLEEGALSSALLMSDEPGQRERLSAGPKPANLTQFGGAPNDAKVFGYAFELDWSRADAGPFGHVLISASAVPVELLGPPGTRGDP